MMTDGSSRQEPSLDAVKEDDKRTVLDVLRVMGEIGNNACSAFVVNLAPKGYEVIGWVRTDRETEVPFDELGLIEQVNELRVKVMGVRINPGGNKPCVRVRVVSNTEKCMVTEATLLKVRKRRRWAEDMS